MEGAGTISVCSSISVAAALAGELTGLNPSYFAGDALTFTAAVSGGASPLAYRMTAEWNGEIFAQEERADGRFTLKAPGADAAGMLRYELYRTGENSVTVVCGLQGLTVTVSEKREAWIQSGMSSSVLGQVSEKWNGLTDERSVDGETPADVGERDREQLSHGPRS